MKKMILVLAVVGIGFINTGCAGVVLAGAVLGGVVLVKGSNDRANMQNVSWSERLIPINEQVAPPAPSVSPQEQAKDLVLLGDDLYRKGNYAAALKQYDEALGIFETYDVCVRIADCLDKAGRKKEANIVKSYALKLKLTSVR